MLIVPKVTTFITRHGASGREILVFRHPQAGVQLPAGTVEDSETFEAAALREAYEETGISGLRIVAFLGALEKTFADAQERRVIAASALFDTPHGSATSVVLDRGIIVAVQHIRDGYAFVTHRADLDPYFPFPGVSGWMPAECVLPHRTLRHLYHLQSTSPLPDTWEHFAEGQYMFAFYWVGVTEHPGLVDGQQVWWDYVIDQLR
ncbi:MAG: NUDIX domain-containing protein [Chloroflexi bacterium]|nr:NUDIX domain-containing protein [Chloroflexota bacterium]